MFGVVAQLIERYVRIVEVVGLSPISSTKKMPGVGHFFYCVHQKYIDKRAHRAVVYFTDFLSSGDMAEW